MNQKNFDQEIIQTLEQCLSKMSKKLKSSFDPDDKPSVRLLQQFRSTISTYHTCLKRAGNVINQAIQPKQNQHSTQTQSSNQNIQEPLSHFKQDIIAKEVSHLLQQQKHKIPTPPLNQPSGLLVCPS